MYGNSAGLHASLTSCTLSSSPIGNDFVVVEFWGFWFAKRPLCQQRGGEKIGISSPVTALRMFPQSTVASYLYSRFMFGFLLPLFCCDLLVLPVLSLQVCADQADWGGLSETLIIKQVSLAYEVELS